MAWRSYPFVCTLHYLIIILIQAYPKLWNTKDVSQAHYAECVSKIKSILPIIFMQYLGCVF